MGASVAFELVRAKSRLTQERLRKVVEDLDDEQLAWRPSPKAHSVGFTLWHTARANDNVQADLNETGTEWERGGYAARWGHPDRGVGRGWDDEKAAALPMPPKHELLAYVGHVFIAVDEALARFDEGRLSASLPSRFMGGESTYGDVILTSVTHDNRHLGEMEYIKGLMGRKGTVTV